MNDWQAGRQTNKQTNKQTNTYHLVTRAHTHTFARRFSLAEGAQAFIMTCQALSFL